MRLSTWGIIKTAPLKAGWARNSRGLIRLIHAQIRPALSNAMSERNRQKGCWRYYELATKKEKARMTRTLMRLVLEHPRPRPKRGERGRPPVHTGENLGSLLLLTTADDDTRRCAVADLHGVRTLGRRAGPRPFNPGQARPERPRSVAGTNTGRDGPPLPRGGRGRGRPVGGRQQLHGSHRVRGGREAQQEGTRRCRDLL